MPCHPALKPKNQAAPLRILSPNLSLYENHGMPIHIFRLPGIYGSGRSAIDKLINGNKLIINKDNHFFSRIHVDDIANILFKSLDNFKNNQIYNICDDKPTSQSEVVAYGAKLLKIKQPSPVKLEEIESEMLQNFYKDSKKVDNKKMKNFFNYNLEYPTYKEGLNYIFNNNI